MFKGLHPTKMFSNPFSNSEVRLLYVAEPFFVQEPCEVTFHYYNTAIEIGKNGKSRKYDIYDVHNSSLIELGMPPSGYEDTDNPMKENKHITGPLEGYYLYHTFARKVLEIYAKDIKEKYDIIFLNGASVSEPRVNSISDEIEYVKIPNREIYGTKRIVSVLSDMNLLTRRVLEAESRLEEIIAKEGSDNFLFSNAKKRLYIPVKHVFEAFYVEDGLPRFYFDNEFLIPQEKSAMFAIAEIFELPNYPRLNPVKEANRILEDAQKSQLGTTERSQDVELISEFSRARQELFDSKKAYKMLSERYDGDHSELRKTLELICAYNRTIISEMYRLPLRLLIDDEVNYFGTTTGYAHRIIEAAAKKEGKKIRDWPIFPTLKIYSGGEAETGPTNKLTMKIVHKSLGNRTQLSIKDTFDEKTIKRFDGI